jgi:uncharacterized protein (DUF2147 family)
MAIRDRSSLRALVLCATATCAALAISGDAVSAADPSGVWLVADQTARIRIEPCADGYWGSIDWERQPGIDTKNPDPAKRGKPLLGTPILIGMKAAHPNAWDGQVYNPKDGGFYKASITLMRPDTLKLEGCMWVFCSGENWTRIPDPRATTGASASTPAHRSVCPQQASGSAQAPRHN